MSGRSLHRTISRKHLLCGASIAALLLGGLPALAEPAAEAVRMSDEVLVTSRRADDSKATIPNTVTVIDERGLSDQLAIQSDFSAMLGQYVPSFSPSRQKLSSAGESFRGRNPLYLVDGVPQSTPLRDGARDGYTVDLAIVERVEIIHGASALQGLGATGGIINYVTRKPASDGRLEQEIRLSVTASDDLRDDGFEYKGVYIVSKKWGALDMVGSLTYHSRGMFYDGKGRSIAVDNTQGDLMDSDQINGYLKLGYDIDAAQRVQVTVNKFHIKGDGDYVVVPGNRATGLPSTSIRGLPDGQPAFNDALTLTADYVHHDLGGGKLVAQIFYFDFASLFGGGKFASFQDPTLAPIGTLFDQSENRSEKFGSKLTYAKADLLLSGLEAAVGLDLLRDRTEQALVETDRLWVPETTFKNAAPFIQLDYVPVDAVTISGGLRYEFARLEVPGFETIAGNTAGASNPADRYTRISVAGGEPSFSEPLFNAGLVVEPMRHVSLFASYSQGFGMPDVGRVLRAVNKPGTSVETFLDLKPVVTDNSEIGASFNNGIIRAQASYFVSVAKLGSRLVADADGIYSVMRERTRISGIELSAEAAVTDWLSVGGNYANLKGRFDSDKDGKVDSDLGAADISPNRLNLHATLEPAPDWRARLQSSTYFDKTIRNKAGATTARFDGYTTLDLFAEYESPFGTFQIAVQNLFDKDYLTYYSQATLTNANELFAGRGRSYTLGYRKAF